jgi:hypothetical protein
MFLVSGGFLFVLLRFSADFEGNTQQSSGEQQSTTKTTTHKHNNTTGGEYVITPCPVDVISKVLRRAIDS